jgi:hypothetical protein
MAKTSILQNAFTKNSSSSFNVKHRSIVLNKSQIKFQSITNTPQSTKSSKFPPNLILNQVIEEPHKS